MLNLIHLLLQSRAKRWSRKYDPFKPVPGGFKMIPHRKVLPPK